MPTQTTQTTIRVAFTARELIELALQRLAGETDLADFGIPGYNQADIDAYHTIGDFEDDGDALGLDIGLRSGVSMATARGRRGAFIAYAELGADPFVVRPAGYSRPGATTAAGPLEQAVVTVQIRRRT